MGPITLALLTLAASVAYAANVPLPDLGGSNDCSGRGPLGFENRAKLCMRDFALSHFTGNASSTLWAFTIAMSRGRVPPDELQEASLLYYAGFGRMLEGRAASMRGFYRRALAHAMRNATARGDIEPVAALVRPIIQTGACPVIDSHLGFKDALARLLRAPADAPGGARRRRWPLHPPTFDSVAAFRADLARRRHRGLYLARRDSAEHFFRSNALHCTATARILIPAECSAVS